MPEWRRWQSPGAGPGTQTIIWNTNTAGKSNGTQIRDFFFRTNFSSERRRKSEGAAMNSSFSIHKVNSSCFPFLGWVLPCWKREEVDRWDRDRVAGGGRQASNRVVEVQVAAGPNHQQQGLSEPCKFSSIFPGIVGCGCSFDIRHQLLE